MSDLFDKSIRTLELPRVLERLAEQAATQEGKERCLALRRERKRATRPTTASASAARKKTTGTTFRVLLPDVLLVGG